MHSLFRHLIQEDQRQPDLISDWVFEISLGWEMCRSRANGKKCLRHDYAFSLCISGRWELPYYSWGSVGNDDHFWCHVVQSDHSQSVSQPPLWSSFALPLFSLSIHFSSALLRLGDDKDCVVNTLSSEHGGGGDAFLSELIFFFHLKNKHTDKLFIILQTY